MLLFVAVACSWWFISKMTYICQTNIDLFRLLMGERNPLSVAPLEVGRKVS